MCLGYVCVHVIVHECMCTCEHIMRIYSGCVSMYEFGVYLFIICTVGICLSMCVYNPSI